jgi:ribosomal-protein-serine acetyltransferase
MFGFTLDEKSQLKIFEKHHAADLYTVVDHCRSYLREWLPWVDSTDKVEVVEKFIESTRKQFADNNGFQAGIWFDGKICGALGYHAINWSNKSTSLGYWLDERLQGKGLMTKACHALIDYAFTDYKLNRVEIRCATGNKKSRAVAERLGLVHEGTLRQAEKLASGEYVDHAVYAMLALDWVKR